MEKKTQEGDRWINETSHNEDRTRTTELLPSDIHLITDGEVNTHNRLTVLTDWGLIVCVL